MSYDPQSSRPRDPSSIIPSTIGVSTELESVIDARHGVEDRTHELVGQARVANFNSPRGRLVATVEYDREGRHAEYRLRFGNDEDAEATIRILPECGLQGFHFVFETRELLLVVTNEEQQAGIDQLIRRSKDCCGVSKYKAEVHYQDEREMLERLMKQLESLSELDDKLRDENTEKLEALLQEGIQKILNEQAAREREN